MLLNPANINKSEPLARVVLKNHEATIAFGKSLSQALNDEVRAELGMDTLTIGLIAPTLTGKSTLSRGIYNGLGSEYSSLQMAMIATTGEWRTQSLKGSLIRHFDLAVQPDDDDTSNFPAHWRNLEAGLSEPGIDIVEHAMKFRAERYIALIKMERAGNSGEVLANLYCADELRATSAFQNFMREQGLESPVSGSTQNTPDIS